MKIVDDIGPVKKITFKDLEQGECFKLNRSSALLMKTFPLKTPETAANSVQLRSGYFGGFINPDVVIIPIEASVILTNEL